MLSEYKNKIYFLIGLSGLSFILFCSCNNDDAALLPAYKITGFYTQPIQVIQWDTLSGISAFTRANKISVGPNYHFGLLFKSKISLVNEKPTGNTNNLQPAIWSNDYTFSADSISEISVYSNQDFDEENKAGDNLNDKFLILTSSSNDLDHKPTAVPLNEFLKKPQRGRSSYTLLLKDNPKTLVKHKFTVHYRKEDNALYVISFPEVSFTSELPCHNENRNFPIKP